MNKTKTTLVAILTLLLGILTGNQVANTVGQAQTGISTRVATSSTRSVGAASITHILSASLGCDSRIISTTADPIILSFGSTTADGVLSATSTLLMGQGHIQPASTTVAYDSGLYGCGVVQARGQGATTTITVSETK